MLFNVLFNNFNQQLLREIEIDLFSIMADPNPVFFLLRFKSDPVNLDTADPKLRFRFR